MSKQLTMFSQCKEGTDCLSAAQLSVWKCRAFFCHTAQEHTFHPYYTPREHILGVLKKEVLSSMEMKKRQGVSIFTSWKIQNRVCKARSFINCSAVVYCISTSTPTLLFWTTFHISGFLQLNFKRTSYFLGISHWHNRSGYKDKNGVSQQVNSSPTSYVMIVTLVWVFTNYTLN